MNDPAASRPLPTTFAEYQALFASSGGDSSRGHTLNPKTGRMATGGTDRTVRLWSRSRPAPSVASGL